MKNVIVVKTPLSEDALNHLRDKTISPIEFRRYAQVASHELLGNAIFRDDLEKKEIETPLTQASASFLKNDFVFVTILRAGLAMLPIVQDLIPGIPVGLIGLRRDEKTAIAKEYYCNLPTITSSSIVILADPMLATGGSIIHALKILSTFSPKEIRVASIISAPEGIEAVHKEFSKVPIITTAIDSHLNDKKYIVPGLGDFGDRYFGTA